MNNSPRLNFRNYVSVVILLIAIHAFLVLGVSISKPRSSYSLFDRTWGFDHVKYTDLPGLIVFYALAIILALPFTNNLVVNFLLRRGDFILRLKKYKPVLFAVISIISMLVFYQLSVKYFFLGDMNIRIAQTMKKDFLATEYLTMRLLYHFTNLFQNLGYSSTDSFRLMSYLAGGVFVYFNLLIADLLGKGSFQKITYFAAAISTGLVLVFCGYVEIYALPCALAVVYIYAGLKYAGHKKYFWIAALSLAVAIGFHLLCVALAPSLLVAWYHHNKPKVSFISKMTDKRRLLFMIAGTFAAIVLIYKTKTGFVLPLQPPKENLKYLTLLSFRHIWEFINGQLLGCGVSFIAVGYLLFKGLREKLTGKIYFLMTVYLSMLLLIFFANLHRGSGDWDIMAFTGLNAGILVLSLMFHLYKHKTMAVNYFIIVMIGFNALNTSTWLYINHTDKSIEKIEDMLKNDPATYYSSKLPGIIQLIYIFRENKLTAHAERVALNACHTLGSADPRGCVMYADILAQQKRNEEAVIFYKKQIKINPNIPQAYTFLVYHYQSKNDVNELLSAINGLYAVFRRDPKLCLKYISPRDCSNIFNYLYSTQLNNFNQAQLNEIQMNINRLDQLPNQGKPIRNE